MRASVCMGKLAWAVSGAEFCAHPESAGTLSIAASSGKTDAR
jgi:hypothetical protein